MDTTTVGPIVGVDLAKKVFELVVADGNWRITERARLSRGQFERWFVNRPVGAGGNGSLRLGPPLGPLAGWPGNCRVAPAGALRRDRAGAGQVGGAAGAAGPAPDPLVVDGDPDIADQRPAGLLPKSGPDQQAR